MKPFSPFVSSALVFSTVVAGCSLEVGNPKKPKPTGIEELSQVSLDSEVITVQSDTGLSVASATTDAATANLFALTNEVEWDLTNSATCETPAINQVVFTVVREKSWQTTETRKQTSVEMTNSRSFTRKRTIDATGATCDNGLPSIPWLTFTSANIQTETTRSHSFTAVVPDALTARIPASRSATTTLTHNEAFTRTALGGGVATFQKSITYSGSHELSLTHKNGSTKSATVNTETLEPIVVMLTRQNGSTQSKTLVSGKTQTTNSTSGEVIQQTFANISYETATNCTPTTGTIAGTILNADGSTRDTFTIVFASGSGTLTYASTGESQSYSPDCQ
jgi:hypothetical protein